jgi:3'-phosphoadenosine 5'-phosphosulfate sulfotransferase (PAPS reductase)/FAD synthetase
MDNAFPLKDWKTLDIWAYIALNGLPYHSQYDIKNKLMGWEKSRFVTFFDPEFNDTDLDKFLFFKFKE